MAPDTIMSPLVTMWLKSFVLVASAVSIVSAAIVGAFLFWTDWRFVPERLSSIEQRLAAFPEQFRPQIVEFRGSGIVASNSVRPGDSLIVVYVLKRAIGCETTIRARFFNHDTNTIAGEYTYEIPAVRSPVATSFNTFAVSVAIPSNMANGVYSYLPEIIPENCGIYNDIVIPPMSEAFRVVNTR